MRHTTNESEVQRTLAAIVTEYEASQRGLCGLAAVARHAAIAARQQGLSERFYDLAALVGDERQAMTLFVAALEQVEMPGNSASRRTETNAALPEKTCPSPQPTHTRPKKASLDEIV